MKSHAQNSYASPGFGNRLGRFTKSLIKRPAKDLDELRNRATKFMQIEELTDYHRSVWSEIGGDKGKEKDGGNRPIFGRLGRNKQNCDPQFFNYTLLNVSRGKILEEKLRAELTSAPKQPHNPRNTDMFKHCQYHHNFGHSTKSCQALKDRIEELIQVGHLCKFV